MLNLVTGLQVKEPFLGLRWKVALTLIVTLLIVTLAVVYVIEQRSTSAFNTINEQRAQRLFLNWHGRLNEGQQTLLQIATFIPLLEISPANPVINPTDRLNQIVAQHSALLDLEWGILSLAFYNREGAVLSAWPSVPTQSELLNLVEKTLHDEAPTSLLTCAPECVQYVASPQLDADNKMGGVLLLGRSLADAIVSFSKVSGVELAVLSIPKPNDEIQHAKARQMTAWGRTAPALSNPESSLPLVHSLAAAYTLEELTESRLFQSGQNWYHATTHSDPQSDITYLLLNDVTDQVRRLDNIRLLIVFSGLAGFMLTTLLLFALLRAPLNRLHALAVILPLIGHHQYNETRNQLRSIERYRGQRDEIDQLVRVVGALNDQLEETDLARTEAEERLIWLADHDPLTGLFNRRRFQRDFEVLIRQATYYGHTGALLYFDLDDFKTVNDLSGHQAGDELLKRLGGVLQNALRSSDLYARLGGDEFAIVLPDTTEIIAANIAKKILTEMHQLEFFLNDALHRISGSIGIALFPQKEDGVMELLAKADIAMYEAKRLGGGTWHLFSEDDELLQILTERTLWRDRINHALEHDQLELRFQPILDLETHTIVRHEALVQMRDGDNTKIRPDQFIPIAEKTGQIHAIDRWVVEKSIDMIKHSPNLSLSVNISGSVVDAPGFIEWLKPKLNGAGVDPTRLVFEITETVAIENIECAVEVMDELHRLGCRFALDDFGSGYASYNYLKRLPVDVIKIDGAYIRNLLHRREDQLFVRALSELAHGLGKLIIAEFVSDKDTLALLRDFGIRYAQGYYVGKPELEPITIFCPEESTA